MAMTLDPAEHTDDNRRWLLDCARGDITSDDACLLVRAMRLNPDLADKDPQLADALAEGDQRHPDDPRRWNDGPPPWAPHLDIDPDTVAELDRLHPPDQPVSSSWAPVDLTAALNGEDIPAPELWERSDGTHLIYTGRTHWFQGESESAKSWAAQTIAAHQLQHGHHVLYIDFEDDDRSVVTRLKALGTPTEHIRQHLTYLRPDETLRDSHGRYTDAWTDLAHTLQHPYRLCIIDGVTEAMTTEGLNLLDNADIAAWTRLLPKRIATLGAAVICIDHVVKDREGQGRYAIGGQHKLAGVTGAVYRFVTIRPLARSLNGDPVEGVFQITIHKDRPGYVRGRSPEGQIGLLTLTAYPDGGISSHLNPPGAVIAPEQGYATRILEYLDTYDGVPKSRIEEDVQGGAQPLRQALAWMVGEGWVRVDKVGRSHLHYLTEQGRKEL